MSRLWIYLLPGTLALGMLVSSPVVAASPSRDQRLLKEEIKTLKKQVGESDNPDSVRYALALAHRNMGSIEDRYRALELFEKIRRSYDQDPEYHREVARTYEASGRPSDARRTLEQVLKLRPDDVEARVDIARLLLQEFLYRYDLDLIPPITQKLEEALDLEPDHRDALFQMSLALHLARGRRFTDDLPLNYRGKVCAERILEKNPNDLDARFLLAIHYLDLDEVNLADQHFNNSIAAAPEEVQQAFLSSRLTAHPRLVKYADTLDPKQEPLFHRSYWRYYDPTPLTLANENQLEFWRRMALAEFFFGDPENGVPGWETDPGKAFVRYGPPNSRSFDPGMVSGSGGKGVGGQYKATLQFTPPSWRWNYSFRNVSFSLRFEDRSLRGRFLADDPSSMTIVELEQKAPVVFQVASPGAIQNLYMTAAGVVGPGGKIRQSIHVGLPPWRDNSKQEWLEDSRFEILVRDSTFTKIYQSATRVRADNLYRPFPGTEILLFSQKYDLAPGKYTITTFIHDKDRGVHGSFSRPLLIEDYTRYPTVKISDLELALTIAPDIQGPKINKLGRTYLPNPMGLVGDERNLDVFYELYQLASRNGYASYLTRYTILPRQYVLGYDRHVARGTAYAEDLIPFAASGLAVGGVTLGPKNFSDVNFPRETVPLKPGERMSKGSRVDVSNLDPGEYVLVVTVTDAFSQTATTAQILFQILTDENLRVLLSYREPEE